ncbi:hypothetical protein ACLWWF_001647 [Campylobacter jejuni]
MKKTEISKTLLKAYKTEYETTDISLDTLLIKYGLDETKIDTSTWQKRSTIATKPQPIVEVLQKPIDNQETISDKIEQFKVEALNLALTAIKNFDKEFDTVKDFKDLVLLVDTIEKSYKNSNDDKVNVNIVLQNILQNYKDDC